MSEPRITLAIPFFRGLDYLREAIESALAQQERAVRVLVSDDRGEPGAEALVASFLDPRLAYRANETTLGMVGNWNRCLDVVDTELVTLLHADDRLLPDYVSLVLDLHDAHPGAVAVCCAVGIVDATGRPVFSLPDAIKRWLLPAGDPWLLRGEAGLRALARGNFVNCPTLCFRRARLGERRFEADWKQVQDLALVARLLLAGETIVGSRRRAYVYRRHEASATERQSRSLLRFEEEWHVLDRIAVEAHAAGWPSAARTARRKAIVRLHLGYRSAWDLLAGRASDAAVKLRSALGGAAPEREAATNDTQDREYTLRLSRLGEARWKRWLDVQAPYRWNLRRLNLGLTLEVGCGIGRNLLHLSRAVGVDPNPHSVELARERGCTAFVEDEFRGSDWAAPGRFDSLLFAHVLEHMTFAEAVALVGRYREFVRPGGRVVLIAPQEAGFRSDPTHVEFLDFERLRQILGRNELDFERDYSFPFPRAVGKVFVHNEFVTLGRRGRIAPHEP